MERETIEKWEAAAYDAGDSESWMIARKALGFQVLTNDELNIPMRRQKQIVDMTPRGAQRLVAKWEKYYATRRKEVLPA